MDTAIHRKIQTKSHHSLGFLEFTFHLRREFAAVWNARSVQILLREIAEREGKRAAAAGGMEQRLDQAATRLCMAMTHSLRASEERGTSAGREAFGLGVAQDMRNVGGSKERSCEE